MLSWKISNLRRAIFLPLHTPQVIFLHIFFFRKSALIQLKLQEISMIQHAEQLSEQDLISDYNCLHKFHQPCHWSNWIKCMTQRCLFRIFMLQLLKVTVFQSCVYLHCMLSSLLNKSLPWQVSLIHTCSCVAESFLVLPNIVLRYVGKAVLCQTKGTLWYECWPVGHRYKNHWGYWSSSE